MRFEFAALGTVFSTRERGAKVRAQIEEALRATSEREPLVLDFQGVQLISFSFADEVVGRLVAARSTGELGDRPILIINAGEEVVHPTASSMERRKLIVACLQPDGIKLIGAAGHIQATFDAATARGEFRTPELAADLGTNVQALNNRLKPLLVAGLLVRQSGIPRSGGREYVYRIALPSAEAAAV